MTLNADPGKYVYTGYGMGFDLRLKFSLHVGNIGKISLFLK